jgi:hypothetical protein
MERLVIVARLKDGCGPRAEELIAAGPPFDLAETGIVRHSIHLSAWEVVFVFEGHQVKWLVDDLIYDPFRYELQNALDAWRSILDGSPRVARERFSWEAQAAVPSVAAGGAR